MPIRIDDSPPIDPTPLLETVARVSLRIRTLEVQNSDRLDFHELHVSSIANALRAAYDLGRSSRK